MAEFDKFGTSWSGAVIFHPPVLDTGRETREEEDTLRQSYTPRLILLRHVGLS